MGLNETATSRDKARQPAASLQRKIRNRGKCEKCNSIYALELDHRHLKALGGSDAIDNLRLLCRFCNQCAAIEALGLEKMDIYLERPKLE